MQVGPNAVKAIIGFEIGSDAYYNEALSKPVWPGGASGLTIGIGYDLGQHTVEQITADWGPSLPAATVAMLVRLSGLKGDAASIRRGQMVDIEIPFAAAQTVFENTVLPEYAAGTEKALPNCSQLHPDAFGALVSLSYNRGFGGYAETDDRHREMRMIHAAMAIADFAEIPGLIRDMKRLWENNDGTAMAGCAGLIARREAEAVLFETAQAAPAEPAAPAAA